MSGLTTMYPAAHNTVHRSNIRDHNPGPLKRSQRLSSWIAASLCCVALFAAAPPAVAQNNPREIAPGKTDISLELFVSRDGALKAQSWSDVMRKLNVPVRIRVGLAADTKPELRERIVGTLRYIQLTGIIDRSGRLRFADRSFSRSDTQKLTEWLDELRTYGAQGAPDGQPAWGLNKQQFTSLIDDLDDRIKEVAVGTELQTAVKRIHGTSRFSLRYSAAATEWISTHPDLLKTRQTIVSLSRGSALAAALKDSGLGFRPLRNPSGTIELVIDPIEKLEKPWPVGWELPKDVSRYKTAPKLFELLPVEFENVAFLDVITAVSIKTELPIVLDYYDLQTRADIQLDQLQVSYPPKKVSWLQVLRGITSPHRMSTELVVDERDRPFIRVELLGRLPNSPARTAQP